MDIHVSGSSIGPRLTDLGEKFASLRPRVVARTPEQTQGPVRPLREYKAFTRIRDQDVEQQQAWSFAFSTGDFSKR